MVTDGRVMDYSNGMERVKKKGNGKKELKEKPSMVGREKAREKTKKGGKDGHREVGRRREKGREGNSYIKILKMYECI